MLTMHGIIPDDLTGYVTGTPSPYLQNYVAQRGGVPSLPGQILPDPLPGVPQMQQQPVNDTYQKPQRYVDTTPQPYQEPSTQKKGKGNIWKSIAMSVILSVGASLLLAKGIRTIKGTTIPPAPAGSPWYQKFVNLFKV